MFDSRYKQYRGRAEQYHIGRDGEAEYCATAVAKVRKGYKSLMQRWADSAEAAELQAVKDAEAALARRSSIKKMNKADLEKDALNTPMPWAHARNDAIITVCGGTREPLIRENIMTMIEVLAAGDKALLDKYTEHYHRNYDSAAAGMVKYNCRGASVEAFIFADRSNT